MASVLLIARRQGMSVVGEPEGLDQVDEADDRAFSEPATGTARLATALAISPLVRRAAGLAVVREPQR
jgi:hypothetical protein